MDPEQVGLALGGHDRLDRLLRPRQLDAVARSQQLVNRLRLSQYGHDPVEALGVEVEQLHPQRLVVGQADPLDLEDLVALLQADHGGHIAFGQGPGHADQPRRRLHAPGPDKLGMARQLEHLVDLGLGDEGTFALVAMDALLGGEAVKGLAYSPPGDAEAFAQLPLGRHRRAGGKLLYETQQRVAQHPVLGLARLDGLPLELLAIALDGRHPRRRHRGPPSIGPVSWAPAKASPRPTGCPAIGLVQSIGPDQLARPKTPDIGMSRLFGYGQRFRCSTTPPG